MSRANIFNTRTINYLELIGNGKRYRAPPYQRDYSWSEEQWEDLWNDVLELRGRPDDRHYMGALIVEGTSDREFLIIDGQQRMATLSLLALARSGRWPTAVSSQRLTGNGPMSCAIASSARRIRLRSLRAAGSASTRPTTRSTRTTDNRSIRAACRSPTGYCGTACGTLERS